MELNLNTTARFVLVGTVIVLYITGTLTPVSAGTETGMFWFFAILFIVGSVALKFLGVAWKWLITNWVLAALLTGITELIAPMLKGFVLFYPLWFGCATSLTSGIWFLRQLIKKIKQ